MPPPRRRGRHVGGEHTRARVGSVVPRGRPAFAAPARVARRGSATSRSGGPGNRPGHRPGPGRPALRAALPAGCGSAESQAGPRGPPQPATARQDGDQHPGVLTLRDRPRGAPRQAGAACRGAEPGGRCGRGLSWPPCFCRVPDDRHANGRPRAVGWQLAGESWRALRTGEAPNGFCSAPASAGAFARLARPQSGRGVYLLQVRAFAPLGGAGCYALRPRSSCSLSPGAAYVSASSSPSIRISR